MEGGETPMRYLSGIVILENGMECEFALREDAVRLIEQEARHKRKYRRMKCDLRNYNLADELVCGAIDPYLSRLAAKQKETPAVGAAGESG